MGALGRHEHDRRTVRIRYLGGDMPALFGLLLGEALMLAGVAMVFVPAALIFAGLQVVVVALFANYERGAKS